MWSSRMNSTISRSVPVATIGTWTAVGTRLSRRLKATGQNAQNSTSEFYLQKVEFCRYLQASPSDSMA